ncbi:MAG: hypothetical protein ACYCZX_02375 [Rhodospirillaceae bacterium]
MEASMQSRFLKQLMVSAAVVMCAAGGAMAAGGTDAAPRDGTLGLALTYMHWSIYQTAGAKEECPTGMNVGSREELTMQFPDKPGVVRTYEETALNREAATWNPDIIKYQLPFKEAQGKISLGMNLDGMVGPNDFTSPEGEPGVDNQLFRAIGCVDGWRGPNGVLDALGLTRMFKGNAFDRVLVEITDLDSLANDDSVEVTTYRGLDPLLTDATGTTIMPGGSQRIDTRYGAKLVSHRHGRIVNGILTTDPADWTFPEYQVTTQLMRDTRFRLKLTPNGAEGMIAGYADIKDWYTVFVKGWSTIRSGQGLGSEPSHARALERLADAYPDPQTGKNTAISAALDARFVQVFIQHPQNAVAAVTPMTTVQRGEQR